MPDYTKAANLLIHEWSVCDAGLARYDTLAFNFRAWAIAAYGAALAAAAVSGGALAAYIPPIVLILVSACWWADGLYRTLQDHYLSRATEIQLELQYSFSTANSEEYLRRFLQDQPWIGPSFASVPKGLRGKDAIIHMAWQPHIRWFYLPLFIIALVAWLFLRHDPARPQLRFDDPLLWMAIFVLGVAWIKIRLTRSAVDKWRVAAAEEKDQQRTTRVRVLAELRKDHAPSGQQGR